LVFKLVQAKETQTTESLKKRRGGGRNPFSGPREILKDLERKEDQRSRSSVEPSGDKNPRAQSLQEKIGGPHKTTTRTGGGKKGRCNPKFGRGKRIKTAARRGGSGGKALTAMRGGLKQKLKRTNRPEKFVHVGNAAMGRGKKKSPRGTLRDIGKQIGYRENPVIVRVLSGR